MKESIIKKVEELKEEIIESSKKFISIDSVNPRAGGPGEKEVAEWLESLISGWNFDEIKRYDAPDDAVEYGYRPNIVATYKGQNPQRTIWFVTHMDKVPAGDIKLWETDPFQPVVKDGKIFGRGSEDNGASLISTLYAVKSIMGLKVRPKNNIALALVSDEETGSEFGIKYLLKQGIFKQEDWFYVPDAGEPDGSFIEVAEKSIMWLKITTLGKQGHASMPNISINAHRAGMDFAIAADKYFHETYNLQDDLFNYPYSSFEPTKKVSNVENINTIPGTDIIYFDGRILPNYDVEQIINTLKNLSKEYEKKWNVKIIIEGEHIEKSTKPTPKEHPCVEILKESIKELRNIQAKVGGIGGGTCAAIVRGAGFPAVVWSTIDGTAHQPNEYVKIDNLIKDTQVFAYLMSNL
ncbi:MULTISPECIES: M20 family metallo-hydrolase [Petrotoga]|uniref:Succinyl-diaminopimelate desuccinylase n=2 Tax=Petrotoga sibirica TaxID=156202 RepID=A0A4R8EM75_9BACT|nr:MULTISPECIES: M20 family metallo-hydrolase [Petrotoga]KUK82291.1 MAG: Acetylornithine deacetylase or succinyl-diaminopimelate desuccinylase [Petrotoga mobilis]POZ88651.1 diaminopimelate aminotransferase [Petrotoga sibirica DSM 13575]POZ90724.1 diaminopimelate aminotransferase [Petrotoga sp. SL27]TDX13270.1 succinyl-diaminopimelate desuccinylase [Petrotoga sibirica]